MDDAHVHSRLARELVAKVLGAEDPAGAGRDDRGPGRLRAPEGDRCRRRKVIRGGRALRLRRRPDTRPRPDERDRPHETAQKRQSPLHCSSFPDLRRDVCPGHRPWSERFVATEPCVDMTFVISS